MNTKEYNGWTNYETWLVKLWMDNDQGSYLMFQEQAEEHYRRNGMDDISDLADSIKEAHEEMLPEVEGFAAGLLNAAMSEVNWYEIAESLLNDAKEVVGEDEEETEEA